MKIDRIELYHVAMPLIAPWRTAYGEDAAVESVLCRMVSGEAEGWGESAPFAAPCYSPEWAGGVFAVTRDWLAPALLGQEVDSGASLQNRLAHFKGNSFAKAVLDTAWWSLHAEVVQRPLHELLGAHRDWVPVGADFGVMDQVEPLLEAVEQAVRNRFSRVKLKFRPGWDLPIVRAVRERFPELTLHIDCNSGYQLEDLELFQEVDSLGLAMIEQPLAHDDLSHHARLQEQLQTPICLDESITNRRRAIQAIELGSCRYMNIKPGRVGGLTVAVEIHDLCHRAGIPCWVGGMLESAVGSAHCVALAMLDHFTYPADIFPSARFYVEDLAESPLALTPNLSGVPGVKAPQRGTRPHPQRLAQCTRQQATIT